MTKKLNEKEICSMSTYVRKLNVKSDKKYQGNIKHNGKYITQLFETKADATTWVRVTYQAILDDKYRIDSSNFADVIDR